MLGHRDARILLFGPPDERAARLRERLVARGLSIAQFPLDGPTPDLSTVKSQFALLMLETEGAAQQIENAANTLAKLKSLAINTFVWGGAPAAQSVTAGVENFSPDTSLDEVVGRLTTLAQYAPLVRCLDEELSHMKRLGQQLNRYIGELDKDMRLAGRLQRAFMPQAMPVLPGLRFDAFFRPAAFVSGDIFDVVRIDEAHAGVFIADAMGHGTAAGLITMFLRKALVTREHDGADSRVISPSEALMQMHDGMAVHELPNSNFVTAAYALIDVRNRRLTLARGGHPHPIWIRPDGTITEILAEGGLMGLSELTPEFEETSVTLAPGDKVVFYTDGIEDLFLVDRDDQSAAARFTDRLREWSRLSAEELVAAVGRHLDRREGSLHPDDDATLVTMEVTA